MILVSVAVACQLELKWSKLKYQRCFKQDVSFWQCRFVQSKNALGSLRHELSQQHSEELAPRYLIRD